MLQTLFKPLNQYLEYLSQQLILLFKIILQLLFPIEADYHHEWQEQSGFPT